MNGSTVKGRPHRQQGFLVITLIIIILIVGFIGAAIAYMLSSSGRSVGHSVQSNQALSLAEAGLSKARFLFKANPVFPCPVTVATANPSCSLSAWSAPEALGRGEFRYITLAYPGPTWSNSYTPSAPTTTTTAALSASANLQSVAVNSIANFAPMGQIMVNTNPITYLNYTGTSTDTTICGGSNPCFIDVSYSGSSTISAGQTVSQNQTVLTADVSKFSSLQPIRIADASNLAPFGQVIIADQTVTYTGLSNDSTLCGGTGPCLVGAYYPSGAKLPINSRVSQSQIVLQGQGGVPSLANSQGNRTVASALLMSIQCSGPNHGSGNNGNGCATNGNGGGTGGNNPGNGSNNHGNHPLTYTVVFSAGGWTELVN